MEKGIFAEKIKKYFYEFASINLSDKQIDKFFLFMNYLLEQNKLFNLTSIVDEEKVILKHFLDSVQLVNFINKKNINTDKLKFVDIGTGAGFPGIPLSIVFDQSEFLLIESLNKKTEFLEKTKKLIDAKNISVINGRAEEIAHNDQYREKYDFVLSRAVASMNILSEIMTGFAKNGGFICFYKLSNSEKELSDSKNSLKTMNLKKVEDIDYILPTEEVQKKIYIYSKTNSLDPKFPRRMSAIKNKPL